MIVNDALERLLVEAVALRTGVLPLAAEAGPQELLTALADVRARLDRVEAILRDAVRFRAATKRATEVTEARATEEWDQALARVRASPVRRSEYEGARERYADANLATLGIRRAVREAQQALSQAEETVEVLRLMHRGLDGHRSDLHVMFRALTVERSLDR